MAATDLIVQCMTMSTIEKGQFEGLRAAIEAGTGFAGWHGGIADSYRNSSDYLHLVGGQFACHPGKHPDERVGEQSDNYVPYRIEMLPAAADHPVTAGIGGLRPGDRAVLGAGRRLHRRAGHHHPVGTGVGSVAAARHVAGGLDPSVGGGSDLRLHPRAPGGGARGAAGQHHVERGLLWASR